MSSPLPFESRLPAGLLHLWCSGLSLDLHPRWRSHCSVDPLLLGIHVFLVHVVFLIWWSTTISSFLKIKALEVERCFYSSVMCNRSFGWVQSPIFEILFPQELEGIHSSIVFGTVQCSSGQTRCSSCHRSSMRLPSFFFLELWKCPHYLRSFEISQWRASVWGHFLNCPVHLMGSFNYEP